MSATIPENMLLSDLLKSTGYDCPDSLKDKTFDESTSGGSEVVLENNKEATIDVSSYTAPVEITPTEGKDAMKKATVTLTNIPSGGSATGYGWSDSAQHRDFWFSFGISPTDKTAFENSKHMDFTTTDTLVTAIRVVSCAEFFGEGASYTLTKVSDTQFIVNYMGQDITFTRNDANDFTLW